MKADPGKVLRPIGGPFMNASSCSNWCCIGQGSDWMHLRPACERCRTVKGKLQCTHQDEDLRNERTPEGFPIPSAEAQEFQRLCQSDFPSTGRKDFCNVRLKADPQVKTEVEAEKFLKSWHLQHDLSLNFGPVGMCTWDEDKLNLQLNLRFVTPAQKHSLKSLIAAEKSSVMKLGLCETNSILTVRFDHARRAWIYPATAFDPEALRSAEDDVCTEWFLPSLDTTSDISEAKIEKHVSLLQRS